MKLANKAARVATEVATLAALFERAALAERQCARAHCRSARAALSNKAARVATSVATLAALFASFMPHHSKTHCQDRSAMINCFKRLTSLNRGA